MSVKLACVSTVRSGLPPEWFFLLNYTPKAVSRSSRPARIINALPVSIISNRRSYIFGRLRRLYTSTLNGGGCRSSPPVASDGVAGVFMAAASVETASIKSEISAKSRNQIAMVNRADLDRGYNNLNQQRNNKNV